MRLFAAFRPPPAATAPHAAALAALPPELAAGVRWGARERWHVTVAFYGERDATDGIERRLARLASRTPPLRLALSGAGTFGQGLIWAGLVGDVTTLGRLMHAADDASTRTPRPHLTLGRARAADTDLRPLADALDAVRGPAWTAAELVLVRSVTGPSPRHDVVASWPLAGRAALPH